jgi:hypothetical protein
MPEDKLKGNLEGFSRSLKGEARRLHSSSKKPHHTSKHKTTIASPEERSIRSHQPPLHK